jgi:hypothetical protein
MLRLTALTASALLAFAAPAFAQQAPMSFFVTSKTLGNGGNLGGLAGADAHCQSLAQAAGAGNKTWRAYLSAKAAGGQPAVNAKDRIGAGPWANAKGVTIATSVADLHSDNNKINKETALDEKGVGIRGRRYLQQLDEQCRRPGQRRRRPPRPHRQLGRHQLLELLARDARLLAGQPQPRRRCGPAVLLRDDLGRRSLFSFRLQHSPSFRGREAEPGTSRWDTFVPSARCRLSAALRPERRSWS